MGEFAEFCKGEQMGAFLPLLLATGQAFGHHSFQPKAADLREEGFAGANHALREDQPWMGISLHQLLQPFPAHAQWQGQQRLEPVVKQIEYDIGGREHSRQALNFEWRESDCGIAKARSAVCHLAAQRSPRPEWSRPVEWPGIRVPDTGRWPWRGGD